ncbi:MAG: hypothetical protein II984_10970 [Clostridia bacterium]|nr:hypothetical protein [Clostridia bacterium]
MKRFFVSILMLSVFLCSCLNGGFITTPYDTTFEDGNEIAYVTDDTVKTKYIMSTSGTAYHLESCYIVKRLKEENIRVFYGKEYFIERNIPPCKRCNP